MPTAAHAQVLQPASQACPRAWLLPASRLPRSCCCSRCRSKNDERLASRLGELAALGVTRVVHPWRYRDAEEVGRIAARLVAARDTHAPSA
jgi:hypothetical protein